MVRRNRGFEGSIMTTQAERIFEITGHTSDIGEALDEFETVKETVGELFGENQALSKMNQQLILTLSFSTQAIDVLERETGLFITPRARKWIAAYREQMQKIEATRVKSKSK